MANKTDNAKAQILAKTLNQAIGVFLDENKSPSRKVNELDNRGSHFYLSLYWAEALVKQTDDASLQSHFSPLAQSLREKEQIIVNELNAAQGNPIDLGGYFFPNEAKASQSMRPSKTFNKILAQLGS